MARIIPANFDASNELLDANEVFIRDFLKVKINGWAKFRFSIHAGNSSDVLLSPSTINSEIRQAFIELAKSHYETINSIGCAKFCLIEIQNLDKSNPGYYFRKSKCMKEFYIHLGSAFDNIARLIYIINSPISAHEKKGSKLIRHWIDWPDLIKNHTFNNYISFFDNQTIKEILVLRNNFIHNWRPIILINPETRDAFLSNQIRSDRNYLWHYEEKPDFKTKYTDYKPLFEFLNDDFLFVENTQDVIFEQLTTDLLTFEANYNLEIKP